MGYMHIENLYRPEAQKILDFRWVYALEKIHGTSAHVRWDGERVHLFAGGCKAAHFAAVFGSLLPSVDDLASKFREHHGTNHVTIFGEAYGGNCHGMSATYGKRLSFVAFEVRVGESWLDVPNADQVASRIGLPFVWWVKTDSSIESLDALRDRPSEQAKRNGITDDRPSEGIVIRPPFEVRANNGGRLIAKHKRPEFSERASTPEVDPAKRKVLDDAQAIANEWVTHRRLEHVLDHLVAQGDFAMEEKSIPRVIIAMTQDVSREASGEIVESAAAMRAISSRTAALFKAELQIKRRESLEESRP